MYQFSESKKVRQNESVQRKRSNQTFGSLQKKQTDDTGSLFDDTLHQRLMQSSASGNKDAHPYLSVSGSDNNAVQLKGVVQRANGANAYYAGSGNDWHIHHGDHIKYRSMNETRVNFDGRRRKKIFRELRQRIHDNNLVNTLGSQQFSSCIHWIFQHIR